MRYLRHIIAVVIICAACLEIGARIYWRRVHGTPLFAPGEVVLAYYPELRPFYDEPPIDNSTFNVLLLGASVLDKWGNVEQELKRQLGPLTSKPLRVVNVAREGRMSRDSAYKYRLIDGHFDLVVVYHAINDVYDASRPPELHQDGYAQYAWYQEVDALGRHTERSFFILPWTLHFLALRLERGFISPPEANWVLYEGTFESAASFRANLVDIVNLASRRRDRLVLMTFAYFPSVAFTRVNFTGEWYCLPEQRKCRTQLWGDPSNVAAGIAAHNEVIKDLAESEAVAFVDQEAQMPNDMELFTDICHLTDAGSTRFVENLIRAVRVYLR